MGRRIGLRARLHISFAAAALAVMIAFGGAFFAMEILFRQIDRLNAGKIGIETASETLSEHCRAIPADVALASDPRSPGHPDARGRVVFLIREIRDFSGVLQKTGIDAAMLAPLASSVDRLEAALGATPDATRKDTRAIATLAASVADEGTKLTRNLAVVVAEADRQASRRFAYVIIFLLVLLFIAAAAVLSISLGIGRSLVRRIERLQECMGKLAKGDYSTLIPCDGNDELTDIGRTLGVLVPEIVRRETELRESEERYRILSEAAFEGIGIAENGTVVAANSQLACMIGYGPAEIVGIPIRSFIFPGDWELVEEKIRTGAEDTYESRIVGRDGSVRSVEIRGRQVPYHGRSVRVAAINDITDRKRAEEEIRRSEARYRFIYDNAPVSLWDEDFSAVKEELNALGRNGVSDVRGYLEENPDFVRRCAGLTRVLDVNETTLRMYGAADKAELFGGLERVLAPESVGTFRDILAAVAAGETFFEAESANRRLDGETFDIYIRIAIPEETAAFRHLLVSIVDITERKRMLATLHKEEQRYRALFEGAMDGIAIMRDGFIVSCNRRMEEIFRCGRGELTGRSPLEFSPVLQPDGTVSAERVREVEAAALSGVPQYFEWSHVDLSGIPFSIEVSLSRIDYDGRPELLAVARDITDRKRAEAALQESEKLQKLLLERSPLPLVIQDRHGNVTYLNDKFVATFGYTAADIPHVDAWWPLAYPDPEYRETVQRAWEQEIARAVAEGTEIEPMEALVTCKDGTRRYVEGFGTPVEDILLFVLNDITPHKTAEEALLLAKQEADAANRAKTEFLANMSHEIRTPLTSIIGFADLIIQEGGTRGVKEYLELISASGDALLNVVNDVLDLAKIEAGKLELEEVPFDLQEVIRQATAPLASLATAKGVDFRVDIAPETPLSLRGDPEHLRQILANIVSNAVKFTDRGEVVFTAAPGREPEPLTLRGTVVRFTIRDTGIGIPEERQAKIFDSFTQADGSISRKHGGSGLGTTIARRLAELMGGTLTFVSAPGAGTTFLVTIPFIVAEPGERDEHPPLPPTSVFATLQDILREKGAVRVLLAEDNLLTQRLVVDALQSRGHRIDTANNGREAVDAWLQECYDLVLMDLQMPGMNGLEATAEIRRLEAIRGGHTPIVAVTANVMREDRERAIAAGADDYISKPINIYRLLGELHGEENGRADVFPMTIEEQLDLSALPAALLENREKLDEYVDLLLKDFEKGIARMERGVANGDKVEIEKASHAVKGAAVHLRTGTLQDLAAEAERIGALADFEGASEKLRQLKAEYQTLREFLLPARGQERK